MKKIYKIINTCFLGAALAAFNPGLALAQEQIEAGQKVFSENCTACHSLDEQVVGPALKGVHDRHKEAWIKSFIQNSGKLIESGDKEAVAIFEKFGKIQMPAFESSLSDEQVTAVVAYLKNPGEATAATGTAPAAGEVKAATPDPAPAFSLTTLDPLTLMLGILVVLLLVGVFLMMMVILVQLFPLAAKMYERPEKQNTLVARLIAIFRGEAGVLVKKDKNIIMEGHDYDGIHEFDNDLPPWWRYLFYACIVFAGAYLVNFHVLGGKLQDEEYIAEMQAAAQLHPATEEGSVNEKTDYKPLTDAVALEKGKTQYQQNCAACHGQNAEGKIGPNLTDEYWLHGGDINEVFKTIKFGVTEKGMVAWNGKLSKDQILEVSSYILSLQGSNPAGAKEPQGEKVSK